jgi:N-acetylglucosaminyl-diphospho-decaprenol L-rhamnosyltransferase
MSVTMADSSSFEVSTAMKNSSAAAAPLDVGIIIVNWNGGECLESLLESIDRTRGNLRIMAIVVDNASTDGSPESVERFIASRLAGAADLKVVLIRNKSNVGFSRANNQAFAAMQADASGGAPLLLMLNNDTRLQPESMQTLVRFMRENPNVVAIGPKVVGIDGETQQTGRSLPPPAALFYRIQFLKWTRLFRAAHRQYRRTNVQPETAAPIGQVAAAAIMIRADAFKNCDGFDEHFVFGVEDVDLCARMRELGQIFYVPEATVEHRGKFSSHRNSLYAYGNYECGWARYLRKHHGLFFALLYKVLVTLDMPVRVLMHATRLTFKRIKGRTDHMEKHRELLGVTAKFTLIGLPRFWIA